MPRGCKPAAKALPKSGKPAAKKVAAPKKVEATRQKREAPSSDTVEPQPTPRKEVRRRKDEAVNRIMREKLGHIDGSLIAGKRNQHGQTAKQVISNALAEYTAVGRKLPPSWWRGFHKEFRFDVCPIENMPLPPSDVEEEENEELLEVLSIASDSNPTQRRVGPLERFLEQDPILGHGDMYLIAQVFTDIANLDQLLATKANVALLSFSSRTVS